MRDLLVKSFDIGLLFLCIVTNSQIVQNSKVQWSLRVEVDLNVVHKEKSSL